MYVVTDTFEFHLMHIYVANVDSLSLVKSENQIAEGLDFLLVSVFRLCQLKAVQIR